jgi:hypothetical protein
MAGGDKLLDRVVLKGQRMYVVCATGQSPCRAIAGLDSDLSRDASEAARGRLRDQTSAVRLRPQLAASSPKCPSRVPENGYFWEGRGPVSTLSQRREGRGGYMATNGLCAGALAAPTASGPEQPVGLRQSSHSIAQFSDGAERVSSPELSTTESPHLRAEASIAGSSGQAPWPT